MRKKFLSILLVVGLCGTSTAMDSHQSEVVQFTETLYAASGSDFEFSNGTITRYTGDATHLVIPETINGQTVTEIASLYTYTVQHLTIPNTVREISAYAFDGEYVASGSPISYIKVADDHPTLSTYNGVLYNKDKTTVICFPQSKLDEHVVIPDTVTEIASGAYSNASLRSVYIPDSVMIIGEGAFFGNRSLSEIRLPAHITRIEFGTFSRCPVGNFVVPEGVTTIEENNFYEGGEMHLTLPMSLSYISDSDFRWCEPTFYSYEGSYAQSFAAQQNIPFVSLGEYVSEAKVSDWAIPFVEEANEQGLITSSLGEYYTLSINRGQIAELLVNMVEKYTAQELMTADSSTFTDTTNESVLKAYNAGIISGLDTGIFGPHATATREQIAVMIYKTILVMEESTGNKIMEINTDLSGYGDFSQVSTWAKDAVAILANNDIMKGTDTTTLSPKAETTIEQGIVLNLAVYKL